MNKKIVVPVVAVLVLGLMAICYQIGKQSGTQTEPAKGGQQEIKEPAKTSTGATEPAAGTTEDKPVASDGQTKPSDGTAPNVVANSSATPQVKPGQQNVDIENLPSDMVILTVAGAPISVGQYRRMFKMQQVQMEALAVNNPMVRNNLLQQGQKLKIALTPDEKARLIKAARQSKAPDEAGFKKFLADNKVSAAEFDKQIVDVGVAVKTVNTLLQQTLLNDLINRELLCKFGKASGFEGKAMNKYVEFKHSPDYDKLLQATKLSPDDLRLEIVSNELSKMMMEKVQKRATINDAELAQVYSKNKKQFQHKERIRLSQIIVAAPNQDVGNIKSVANQVKKELPKLTGKELDDKVKQVMNFQKQKAAMLLDKARSGGNFAELANQNTDDMNAKNNKTGGDTGFQEKQNLMPELAKALWPLKAGQVYPGLVQTPLGFLIIKVTAHEGAGPLALNEVKNQLKPLVLQQKQQQVVNGWLNEKRQTTKLVLAPKFASLLGQAQANQTSALNALPQ